MESKAIQKYTEESTSIIASAHSIHIVDADTRAVATGFSTSIRGVIRSIEEEFRPDIDKAHQLHKDLLDRLKRLQAPFREAQGIVDGEIKRDYLERERIRQEEARKAAQKAEDERKAQEATLTKEVDELISEGEFEAAEELCDSTVVVVPDRVVAVDQTVRTERGSTTVKKDIEITVQDKMVVLKAVLEDKLPEVIVQIDLGAAKRYAKASGKVYLPGFIIKETAVVAGRVR